MTIHTFSYHSVQRFEFRDYRTLDFAVNSIQSEWHLLQAIVYSDHDITIVVSVTQIVRLINSDHLNLSEYMK